MQSDTQKLIHHISRLEGQLASIKRELGEPNPNCEKSAQTLKAASRSFSSLRMAFVACFIEHTFSLKKQTTSPTFKALLNVINS